MSQKVAKGKSSGNPSKVEVASWTPTYFSRISRKFWGNKTVSDRWLDKVHKPAEWTEEACWEWVGAKTGDGYGYMLISWRPRKPVLAHRYGYEYLVGPIPDGLVIDHLCRNKLCVNPNHLEPVTIAENTGRGLGAKGIPRKRGTHCHRGHERNATNTYEWRGQRKCRACSYIADKKRGWRRGAERFQ